MQSTTKGLGLTMQMDSTISVGLLLASALLIAIMLKLFRKQSKSSITQEIVASKKEVEANGDAFLSRIVIGENPDFPVVIIDALPSTNEYEIAKPLDAQNGTSISRLSALCQAIPSLLVAGEASGKRLMEVVINGDLVRASDGNGLRAFTMASKGIKEHARIFDVQNLQNMINAAAIWQIASVVVAQKHLADISRKLDEIKDGVQGISRFLDNQRKSRIRATYAYLGQIYQAIRGGELSDSARILLEICERDLLEIQHHLEMEYRQKVDKKIKHTETAGTKDLTRDITSKMQELDLITEEIALCIKTRIAAWHVFSLFPGEPQLKLARRSSIQESIDAFKSLAPYCEAGMKSEISAVDAFWTPKNWLVARRQALTRKCDSAVNALAHKTQQASQQMAQSEQLLLDNDRPTRLIFQFENGVFVGARQRS